MIKLFFLELSLLCFFRDGDASLLGFSKRTELQCVVCEVFSQGICVKGESTCTTTAPRGCRSKIFYMLIDDGKGWRYSYATLDCVEECVLPVVKSSFKYELNLCCGRPFCNKKYLLIQ